MIQKPDIIPGYNFEHILHIDNEYEHVYYNHQTCDRHYIEPSANDAFHLTAAVLVEATVDILLVLDEQVQVVFPNSGDFFLGTGHILQVGLETGVLHFTTSLHQEILAKFWEDE